METYEVYEDWEPLIVNGFNVEIEINNSRDEDNYIIIDGQKYILGDPELSEDEQTCEAEAGELELLSADDFFETEDSDFEYEMEFIVKYKVYWKFHDMKMSLRFDTPICDWYVPIRIEVV